MIIDKEGFDIPNPGFLKELNGSLTYYMTGYFSKKQKILKLRSGGVKTVSTF